MNEKGGVERECTGVEGSLPLRLTSEWGGTPV